MTTGRAERAGAARHLSAQDSADRQGTRPECDHPAQSRCAAHRAAARRRASPAGAARSAARHSDPAEGQHRHRRSQQTTRARWRWPAASAAGRDGRAAAARCGRRDHRQGEPERVGELPRLPELERLERRRRPVPQSVYSRPQPLRFQLRVRRRGRGCAHGGGARDRNGRFDRLSRGSMRRRRHQAHGRSDEPRGRRADLAHAGYGRPARTLARGCAAVLGALAGPDPRDPQTAASAGHFLRNYRSSSIRTDCAARASASRGSSPAPRPRPMRSSRTRVQVMRDAGAVARRRRDPVVRRVQRRSVARSSC